MQIFWPSLIQLNQNGKIGNQGEKKFGPVIMSMFLLQPPYWTDRQNAKAVHLQKKLNKQWQVLSSIKVDFKKMGKVVCHIECTKFSWRISHYRLWTHYIMFPSSWSWCEAPHTRNYSSEEIKKFKVIEDT